MMADERKHAACVECREKKLRCAPSLEPGSACSRCVRLGKQCLAPEVKQRKRKARLRGRVDQLESSYAEILSLLRQNSRPDTHLPPTTTTTSATTSAIDSSRPPPSIADTHLSHSTDFVSPAGASNPGYTSEVVTSIDQISRAEGESLLADYRRMSQANFPYVIIPESCSAQALKEERPMLAQAIFIATSWRYPARQAALKANFVRELAERYFIKSERSLDLLQSLIVNFGWCHYYASPVTCQAYRLGSLAVSLAVELGITQRPMNITQHDMIVSSGSAFSQNETASSQFWSYEARRAFVGANTISTFCLLLFRKPSTLVYTQYLDDCASSLATDPQYPCDEKLVYMVRQLHFAEQITHAFDQGSREKIRELSDDRINLVVKTLSRQLADWKASLPLSLADDRLMQRLYTLSWSYLHEVGLYGLLQGQTPSVTRISLIYECFTSAIDYLADVLNTSVSEMSDWTSLDWRTVNFAVMLSVRSSIILDSAYVSPEASQKADWLDKCLDTLCLRTRELHRLILEREGGGPDANERDHYFRKIASDWANVKSYHQNCMQRTTGMAQTPLTSGAVSAPTTTTNNINANNNNNGSMQMQAPAQAQGNRQQQQPPQQPQCVPALSAFEMPFDMDPFSELFWTGFTESDAPLGNVFQM